MLFESRFNSTEQHDAHEFFVHFCNMLQEEGKTENTVKSCEGKSSEAVYSHYFKNNKSIVDRLFVGQTEAVVECVRCQVKSVTYDAFIDIQLDLMDSTLENCLKRRFESDKIEGYDC